MVLEELVEVLKFDFDDKDLKRFNEGVKTAGKQLAAVTAAATAVGAALFAFVENVASNTDELKKHADTLGITVEAYQELIHAAEMSGSSQQSLESSLSGVAKAASEAARGAGGGIEAFGILGIKVTDLAGQVKSADDLLLEVSDSIAGISTQAEKIELLGKLGISQDMVNTLGSGSDAIREAMIEARQLGIVLNNEAAVAAEKFSDELDRSKKAIMGVGRQIAAGLMPEMTGLLESFQKWFRSNREIIKQRIEKFIGIVTDAVRAFYNIVSSLASSINAIVMAFGGWEKALIATGVAWMALNARMLLSLLPLGLILLAIDEIGTAIQGGDSYFGDFLDKVSTLEEKLKPIKEYFSGIAKDTARLATLFDVPSISFGSAGAVPSTPIPQSILNPVAPSVSSAPGGSTSNTANVTVNVTNPNASAEDIGRVVKDSVAQALSDQNRTALDNVRGMVSQ